MRRSGFGLVEVIIAMAVGGILLLAALVTLTRTRQVVTTETEATASMEEAAAALEALRKSIGDAPVAAVLPGADSRGLALLVARGSGYPVVSEGYTPTAIRVISPSGQPFEVGEPVLLTNGAGAFFYLPAVEAIQQIDAAAGVWQIEFPSCANPVRWTASARAYLVRVLTLAKTGDGLEIDTGAGEITVPVSELQFRYVYSSSTGTETILDEYVGSATGGSRLAAVAVYALGKRGATERNLTLRLPLAARVRDVQVCGGTAPPGSGTGVLTVLVLPPPPGGGDLTLSAGDFVERFGNTRRFENVPVGDFTLQAREVWSDSLTLWRVAGEANWRYTGTLHAFAPQTVTATYRKVPGKVEVEVQGVPDDAPVEIQLAGPDAKTLERAGPGTIAVDVTPGSYEVRPLRSTVGRAAGGLGWTEDYDPNETDLDRFMVASLEKKRSKVTYKGPLQGTLCYDDDCQNADPGVYEAPPDSTGAWRWVRTITTSRWSYPTCPEGTDATRYTQRTTKTTEESAETTSWIPERGALSSRGTLRFTSSTRVETRSDTRVLDDSTLQYDCSDGSPDPDGWTVYYFQERTPTCRDGRGVVEYASGRRYEWDNCD